MKRVSLSRFNPLEVSRKVQQCLRFEGVNANGARSADSTFFTNVQRQNETKEDTVSKSLVNDHCSCNRRIKNNILNTIKRKWKNTKRSKRDSMMTESVSNVSQCHSENYESHACSKHFRTRKHKSSDKNNVWPVPSSILRCQNREESKKKSDDVAELIPCLADETEVCSCFGSPKKSNCSRKDSKIASCSKLHSRASCSLSDLSCDDDPINSSLALRVESEGDVSSFSHFIRNPSTLDSSIYDHNSNEAKPDHLEMVRGPLPDIPRVGNLTQELHKLSKYGWYWGPINRREAELKLIGQPDGAFLVRDSSDDRYILSLSFRSYGKTLHTRIEHSSGLFSFYSQPEPEGHASIVELIQQSMCYSQSGVFCYSRSRSPGSPSLPVRLTKPISRFTQVRSLQYLCRFVIRQYTRFDHIQKLPLPQRIKGYLEEGHY